MATIRLNLRRLRRDLQKRKFRLEPFVYLLIFSVTLISYEAIQRNDFITFDDADYIYENPFVQQGLNSSSIAWAFSFENKTRQYWHPVTWISHILDCQFFGLNPAMHHLVNMLLHIGSSLLLFRFLHRATGELWKSALTAILFAVHPINVESVAWAAERKSVLSLFLTLLTLLSYYRYVQKPALSRYLLLLVLFSIALMAKPSIAALPFLLLLLDIWPLNRTAQTNAPNSDTGLSDGRISWRTVGFLVIEKIPFLLLSISAVLISSASLSGHNTAIPFEAVPFSLRLDNALVSYIAYIRTLLIPIDLSVYHPFPSAISWTAALSSGMLLICLSAGIIRLSKRCPAAGIGWLWFLGCLVPASGLVQVGLWPAMADRFVYFPGIGFFILIVWGGSAALQAVKMKPAWYPVLTCSIIILLSATTWHQIRIWRNGATLYAHAIATGTKSYEILSNLGNELARAGHFEEALSHYREALRLKPYMRLIVLDNIGAALMVNKRPCEAKQILDVVLSLHPDSKKTKQNLNLLRDQLPVSGCKNDPMNIPKWLQAGS